MGFQVFNCDKKTNLKNLYIKGPFLPDQATRRAAYKLDITEHLAEFNKMMENHLHSPKEIIREGGTTKPQALLKIITGEAGRI